MGLAQRGGRRCRLTHQQSCLWHCLAEVRCGRTIANPLLFTEVAAWLLCTQAETICSRTTGMFIHARNWVIIKSNWESSDCRLVVVSLSSCCTLISRSAHWFLPLLLLLLLLDWPWTSSIDKYFICWNAFNTESQKVFFFYYTKQRAEWKKVSKSDIFLILKSVLPRVLSQQISNLYCRTTSSHTPRALLHWHTTSCSLLALSWACCLKLVPTQAWPGACSEPKLVLDWAWCELNLVLKLVVWNWCEPELDSTQSCWADLKQIMSSSN